MHNAPSLSLASPSPARRPGGRSRLSDRGPLAQLVERHVYTVDVVGSIPAGPTTAVAADVRVGWTRERKPRRSAPPPRSRRPRHPHPHADAARRNPPQAARVQALLARRQELAQELTTRLGARDDLRADLARIESDVALVDARRARDAERLASHEQHEGSAGPRERARLARAPQERPRGCRARDHGAPRAGRRRRRRAGGAHRRDERRGCRAQRRGQARRRRGDRDVRVRHP